MGITFSCLYSSRKLELDRTKSFRYNRKGVTNIRRSRSIQVQGSQFNAAVDDRSNSQWHWREAAWKVAYAVESLAHPSMAYLYPLIMIIPIRYHE